MTTQAARRADAHFVDTLCRPPVHLSPADLDRMAIAIHREDDPDFDVRDFGAYAPDPDADYRQGFQAGRASALNEQRIVRWYAPVGPRLADGLLIAAVACLVAVAAWAGLVS